MPRIVHFYETGGPEVLRVEDAIQRPRKSEVLLQVEAIGLTTPSPTSRWAPLFAVISGVLDDGRQYHGTAPWRGDWSASADVR
jgi:hypothetical protein